VKTLNVFIVEDSPIVCSHLLAELSALERVVVVGQAAGAQEAIRAIRDGTIDVILLDLRLADGNGLEVLEMVKETLPRVAVIVLTNHVCQPYRDKCLRLQADHFFDKSREWAQMLDAVRQVRDAL
jgi:DNA-binding NarL/FixJ family response regulator